MTDRLKKIAFVSYDFPEYSIRHVNEMANHAEVLLLLTEQTSREYLSLLDPRVRFKPFHKPRLRQPARQVVNALKLLRAIHSFAPDVVHVQNGHMYFNMVMPLLRKFPLVMTIHDVRQHLGDSESGRTPQRIMDFGFRRADHIIVHGLSMVDTVVAEIGFRPEQIHVIPLIALGELDSPETISDDAQSILFFGRIWEYKGLEYLIRAAPRVCAEFPDAKFIIAGRGEDLQRYRQHMHDPASFVVLNDWITDQQRSQLFASCSMVVLPYIEASQSAVTPIAYAYEKPVIVTRIGGLPDMVDHGKTGLLIPPRDSDALAEAVLHLLRDRTARIEMGRAGKQKLLQECTPQVVVAQTLDVYRQTIASRTVTTVARR
ncbi:MAG: glycosyltransferase family 4 protein [Aureliella sp.]